MKIKLSGGSKASKLTRAANGSAVVTLPVPGYLPPVEPLRKDRSSSSPALGLTRLAGDKKTKVHT